MLAAFALAAVMLPLVQAGATAEVVLSGRIAHDVGENFGPSGVAIEYSILETATERLVLDELPRQDLVAGTRVRIRGRRAAGDRLVVGPGAGSLTVLSRPGDTVNASSGSISVESTTAVTSAAAQVTDKRVAVLLINFVDPTPTPIPSATPTPPPTPSPTDSPSPTDIPPATDSPPPSQSPPPSESPVALDEPSPPATVEPTTPPPTELPTLPPSAEPTLDPSPSPSPSPTPTPPPQPWTVEKVRGTYFTNARSSTTYFADVSEGQMSVSGDVFGWYTLSIGTSSCAYSAWGKAAREAATAAGVDLSQYTNVAYAFPEQKSCWWSGLANVVGRHSWMNGTTSLFVTSHELGHNFGIHHASSLRCTQGGQRVAFSTNCSNDEYGDPFDIMGYHGQRHVSTWHRWQLGFLTAADVETVTASGTYRVATAQVPGVPRVLRIARPGGDYYYLEFRQPYGQFDDFSPTASVVNGVTIRIAPDVSKIVPSLLVDTMPDTTTFGDAALGVGRTFSDHVNRVFISTTGIDPLGATVEVHFGPDVQAPSAPGSLTAVATSDGAVTLGWLPSTDDVSVASYRVSRDGLPISTASGTSAVDTPAIQAATYAYSVTAVDQSGNESPPASVSIFVPDSTPPSAPASVSAVVSGPNSVSVSWLPASDNIGVVGYTVRRGEVSLGQTADTQLVDAGAPDGFESTYSVAAFDAAGNVGQPAVVSVGVPDATAPEMSGVLSASVVDGAGVALSWPAATDNVSVSHYRVNRDGAPLASVIGSAFLDAGAAQGVTYTYEVTAVDAAGLASGPLSTAIHVPDTVAPAAPLALSVLLSGPTSASLSWSAAADNVGVDHYIVSRDGTLLLTTAALGALDQALAQATAYGYSVVAVDAAGNTSAPATASLYVPDVTPPSAPVLTATATSPTTVSLSWRAATDNIAITGYVLERNGLPLAVIGPADGSYADQGLPSDRTYVYTLRAVDLAGNESAPSSASVTLVSVDVTPPSKPTNLAAVALGQRRVSLSWQASTDNRPGTISYRLFRGTKLIATLTTLSYVDRPATVGTYRYRVRAVDAAGNRSAFTAYVTVRAVRRL